MKIKKKGKKFNMKNKVLMLMSYIFFSFGVIFFNCINAKAYIDPSVVTYAIQAVAGVAIAIGAFLGIYIRKARKKINQKLGIDENRNKEVEKDEIIIKNKKDK